ncbi:MAG: protein jag [Oscillospiraceae bacterium]|jgi:spoIIIJ-associated protein|nr:protein jag [Oscillospiraceae bacterium]
MIKILQKSAKTEDEAVQLALRELGLDRDDVSVEIVERARSGFLGIGSSPAVVNVSYEAPDEPQPAAAVQTPPSRTQSRTQSQTDIRAEKPAATASTDRIREFLEGLLSRYGVTATVEISPETDGTVNVELAATEPGALIGRRGETLDAIQSLTNYAVNRGRSGRLRINIDTENYRKRRTETLEALAEKTAAKVVRYRRNVTLDPMNAFERHVVHTALQNNEVVSTHSVGSEPNRRVVVAYGKPAGTQFIPRERSYPLRESGAPRKSSPQETQAPQESQAPTDTAPAETPDYREWK